ncbi:hypothetical protein [Halolamina salifodinae]|uniref:Uncharacterized protein n=1 Tax=Halolamina salifodinae TaxID=1202767 RepID=A0A8T4GXR2_9EURY|nr:hypothetical protein [Halolamina salifodinae]MBP1986008.1 hypothetical protein [Halolamina salifodinae]
MSGRRSRRRGSDRTIPTLVLIAGVAIIVVAAFGSAGAGSASFDTAQVDRNGAVNVTDDASAAHALDTADAVHVNATEPLVNVTNRLGTDVTVTVGLRDDSTHIGDLVVGDTVAGNETSFGLAAGATQTVEIEIANDSTLSTETVYFHVNASGNGIEVTAPDRSVPVN